MRFSTLQYAAGAALTLSGITISVLWCMERRSCLAIDDVYKVCNVSGTMDYKAYAHSSQSFNIPLNIVAVKFTSKTQHTSERIFGIISLAGLGPIFENGVASGPITTWNLSPANSLMFSEQYYLDGGFVKVEDVVIEGNKFALLQRHIPHARVKTAYVFQVGPSYTTPTVITCDAGLPKCEYNFLLFDEIKFNVGMPPEAFDSLPGSIGKLKRIVILKD